MTRVAVFASGGGTNLQALLDHFNAAGPARGARIALVVSDRADAGALQRAERAGVPHVVIPVKDRPEAEVAAETLRQLEAHRIGLVALAGYLRLVPGEVVRRYRNRIVNIHPALLPAFGGKGMYGRHVHQAVLGRGCRVTGVTVHLVDERYDAGPILMQWPVPVLDGDDIDRLAARVLRVEHALYPAAVERLAAGAPALEAGAAVADVFRPLRLEDATQFALAEDTPADAIRRALEAPDR